MLKIRNRRNTAGLFFFALLPTVLVANSHVQSQVKHPSTSGSAASQSDPTPMPMAPMSLAAPIFIEDSVTTSQLTMVNSLSAPIDVDVILSDLDGNELAKRTITIGSHTEQELTVRDLLDGASYHGPAYGSVFLVPHRNSTLAAQMSIVRRKEVISDIEEEFVMLQGSQSADFRAVASNITTAPIIAIRSLTTTRQTVTIECLGDAEQRKKNDIPIEPNQTLLVQACLEDGAKQIADLNEMAFTAPMHHRSIGVSVSSSAPSMDLAVFGLRIYGKGSNRRIGGMQFTDVNALRSSTAIYPGVAGESSLLALHAAKLLVSIANFGSSTRNATVLLSKGSDTASAERQVATVNIPPGNVVLRNLDAEALDDPLGLDTSLVVQTDAAIGEVLSDVQSLSSSNDSPLAIPLPWKDQAQTFNGGQHPWRIDGGFSSTVLLFNPDQHAANAVTLSIYSDNKAWTKLFSIPPLATVPVRLADIIAYQQPDDKGKTLSRTSTRGLLTWFTLAKPKIFGQLVQADPANRVVRPFACASGTAVCAATIDDLTVPVAQQGSTNAWAESCGTNGDCSCVDSCVPGGNGTFSSWGAYNSNIASLVSSSGSSATFQGKSPGTTFSSVVVTDNNNCSGSGGGNIYVTPTVSVTCTPVDLALGSTAPTSTSNGSCTTQVNPAGGTFSWSVNKSTVMLRSTSGASISYNSNSASSSQGDTTISVRYTANGQSATATSSPITTHNPTSITVLSDSTNPTGQPCSVSCLLNPGDGTCHANTSSCNYNSYLRERHYTVIDQLNQEFDNVGISTANVTESLPITTSCPNFTFNVHNAPTSNWFDDFFLCHTCCLPQGPGCSAQSNPSQTISVNGIQLRTVAVNLTCSSASLTP